MTPFAALLAPTEPSPVQVDPARDVALLPYSSGTVGLPKGVQLTHRNLVANLVQCQAVLPLHRADTLVAALPFCHIAGAFATICLALSAGATVVTILRFDLEQYLGLIEHHRATMLLVAPPIVAALAYHPLVDRFDLSSLQVVVSSAAPLAPELETACATRLSRPVVQVYGMTEASPVIAAAAGRVPTERRPGSVGVLLPGTRAQLGDPDTGAVCPPGQPGEIWVRGPQVMAGYLNNDAATAATLVDGWLRTGDLGRLDPDGQLFLLDRVKELIKVNGQQVAPAELEALLLEHPAVADAAVIRRPDERCGEVPVGYVTTRAEVSTAELIDHVGARVAPYKQLAEVRFIAQIPRSPAGKILRRVLAEQPS